MAKLTRRGLIKRASVGAGAAGVVAAVVATGAHFAPTNAHAADAQLGHGSASKEPLVIYVSDPSSGKIQILQGERSFTVHNPGLVRSLLTI